MKFLNRNSLKWVAMVIMLVDHTFATLLAHRGWFTINGRIVGRLAFPIFAFQIAQGFKYTKDIKKYLLRLFCFGLISELPFNLLVGGTLFNLSHQNVMFTMFLGLCAIYLIDRAIQSKEMMDWLIAAVGVAGICYIAKLVHTDYNYIGVLTIILFYFTDGKLLYSLLGMIFIHGIIYKSALLPFVIFGTTIKIKIQSFAVLTCFIIGLYNGKKGSDSKTLQYAGYAFYPVHMLILGILNMI